MSTIGIIFTAFNTEQYVEKSLFSWVKARDWSLLNYKFVICAVSCPFEGFPIDKIDRTTEILLDYEKRGLIDKVITSAKNTPIREVQARTAALKYLQGVGCDAVWQVDSDEIYYLQEIQRILQFVDNNPLTDWFRISYKNYVFDLDTYLVEPFTPPRIYRNNVRNYKLHSFYEDNNISYGGIITRNIILDKEFSSMTIPKSIAFVGHLSWLNNSRSLNKINYQKSRNWLSSFHWDEKNGLEFNKEYYKKNNIPLPKVAKETDNRLKLFVESPNLPIFKS